MELNEPSAKYLVQAGLQQTEIGPIPMDWQVEPLAKVAEIRSGIAKNVNSVLQDAIEVPYLRVANVQDGYLDLQEISTIRINLEDLRRYSVLPFDVLMNEGGDIDKLGRGALWRGQIQPCVHQNHVFVVRCKPALAPQFLSAWSASPPARRYFLFAGKQTTNLASINKTSLGQLPVAMPRLREEQERIAQALADADALIASLEQLLSKKRQIKQGAMQELLTGQRRLPGFIDDWVPGVLGDALGELVAGVSVNSEANGTTEGAPSVLKTSAICDGQFDPTECKAIAKADVGRAQTTPRKDSLLVSRMNTPDLVGEVGYVDADYPLLFLPDRVWMAQAKHGSHVNMRWLVSLLSSAPYKQRIRDTATGTSGSMKNISKAALRSLPVHFPCGEEQTAIASVLSDMDAEITALEARLTKARQLKQGMAQALLTGRIRLV